MRTLTAPLDVLARMTLPLEPGATVTRLVVLRPATKDKALTFERLAPDGVRVNVPPLAGVSALTSRTTPVAPVFGTPRAPAAVTDSSPCALTVAEAAVLGVTALK